MPIKHISIPSKNEKLAEFIGIMLGDGNIYVSKKARVYQIKVTNHAITDKEYLTQFVKPLVEGLFTVRGTISFDKGRKGINLRVAGIQLVNYLSEMGLPSGDKIKNKVPIPNWLKKKDKLLIACLRGLFDTDGTVYRPYPESKNWIIGFKNNNSVLLNDVRDSLVRLKFHPTKIIRNAVFLCRKAEIELFIKRIGFSNSKHLNKVLGLVSIAPSKG